ncbi:hypothetical protein chiPu_0028580 [Chiloscyllium punctatum]|uniref:Uncharacterized protein n=1 Tax=Chiloscyllium punctatum TaxID=137246 RepID=A0A401TPX0_CHIPU|nr:hypothetical protein [Chiloscyllium punctatum]
MNGSPHWYSVGSCCVHQGLSRDHCPETAQGSSIWREAADCGGPGGSGSVTVGGDPGGSGSVTVGGRSWRKCLRDGRGAIRAEVAPAKGAL